MKTYGTGLGMALPLTLLWGLAGSLAAQEMGSRPKGPDAQAAAKGKRLYERYCTVCHGPSGMGDGPLATELRMPPADLASIAAQNGGVFPLESVARSIDGRDTKRAHGTPDMPAWGEVLERAAGTEASSVDSAVARLTHYVWLLQRLASD